MPCKHEGGTDPCVFGRGHTCLIQGREYMRKYVRNGIKDRNKSGKAAELLVRAYFLKKGYETTTPDSPGSKHDLHVELPSVGWKGVQVRVAQYNSRTGSVIRQVRPHTSPIMAYVVLQQDRIVFERGTEKLPKELRE